MSSELSSFAQVALWLSRSIGEGTVFTKQQLRAEFPQFEQADRRMRDLRQHGWRIDTNREDAQLRANELRLVTIGAEVWRPGYKRSVAPRVSGRLRTEAIVAAQFQCEYCGAQVGTSRTGRDGSVRLTVVPVGAGNVVACEDCASGVAHSEELRRSGLATALGELSEGELEDFRVRFGSAQLQTNVERALLLSRKVSAAEVEEMLDQITHG